MKKISTEQFIERALAVHGRKYDYSKVAIQGVHNKIEIVCRIHGSFFQEPNSHRRGRGCVECSLLSSCGTLEGFIIKAKKVHGDRYDYSAIKYIKNSQTKVEIVCPKHGSFLQTPNNHTSIKQGCPSCAEKHRFSTKEFIEKANEIHNNKYEYSCSEYINESARIKIKCKEHGEFWQVPKRHVRGSNCPKCHANISAVEKSWIDSFDNKNIIRQHKIFINKKTYNVDGFDPDKNIVYEFLGDFWHGNPKIYEKDKINPRNKISYGELFEQTTNRIKDLENFGYTVVSIWESEWNKDVR